MSKEIPDWAKGPINVRYSDHRQNGPRMKCSVRQCPAMISTESKSGLCRIHYQRRGRSHKTGKKKV